MSLPHALPAPSFMPDERSLHRPSPIAATPHRRVPHTSVGCGGARRERRLTLLLVVVAHAAALYALAQRLTPPDEPVPPPITVALIEPPRPATPPAPPPPPEPVRRETPPPPKAVKPKPAQAAPKPLPAPVPETAAAPPTAASISREEPPPPAPPPAPAARPAAPAPPLVVAARFDAAYLNNPAPAYPPLARRMREEGRVLLRVRVSAEGLPESVQVNESSGSTRLDAAARDAVERWRFVPARQDDQPVAAWVVVPIVFKLEGH